MAGGNASINGTERPAVTRLAIAVILTMMAATMSQAQVRLLVPEESLSGPFYARLEFGLVLQDDGWIAIPFYRETSCVRPNFNLLNFFDFANIPAIFSCSLTVSGFELWDDPETDLAPRQSKLKGTAVPIWFVSVADFTGALPGITKTELLAMPSLMQGTATFFEETLHPIGGAVQTSYEVVASGDLPDGRTFHLVGVEAAGDRRHVRIQFR